MEITKISVLATKKTTIKNSMGGFRSTGMSIGISASLDAGDSVWDAYHDLDKQAKAMVEESLGIQKNRSILKLAS